MSVKMEFTLDQFADQELFSESQIFGTEGELYIDELVNELSKDQLPLNRPEERPEEQPDEQPNQHPVKHRKKKSVVWNHFHIVDDGEGRRRAICNQCSQSYSYSTGTRVNGTSHLKRHLKSGSCVPGLANQSPNTRPAKSRQPRRRLLPTASAPAISFDADRCSSDISRMVTMHDYPLHIVEQPGFVELAKKLQPQFDMVTSNTIEAECLVTYTREKQEIKKVIDSMPGRICLALDLWSSSQTIGYIFVTGQFVDSDGKIQRRLMNVIMDPYPDSDFALSRSVAACVSDWGMDGKLFSVTVNQPLNDAVADNIRAFMSVKGLNGPLLVGSCLAHALRNTVQAALALTHGLVKKVRDTVKYVKTSESREEKFIALKQKLQAPNSKSLSIDDQARWNTTYEMLIAASDLKLVFYCMDTADPDYKGDLSAVDWEQVEVLCSYLKPLFDMASQLTTQTSQTINMFFHEACDIQVKLAGAAATSENPFESALARSMHEEFGKYWNSCCYILAIAAVMDPRFKMKIVDFSFLKLYGEEAAAEYVKIVNEGIHELFREYATLSWPRFANGLPATTNHLEGFDAYIEESTSSQASITELDQYLEERVHPRVHDFDVIGWWEEHRIKYPTVSRMAHDILSIPVSTVPASSVFDTKQKKMDSYRSELRPDTIEALFCVKDWLQAKTVQEVESKEDAVAKMEEDQVSI